MTTNRFVLVVASVLTIGGALALYGTNSPSQNSDTGLVVWLNNAMAAAASPQLPADLPAYAQAYRGAQVQSVTASKPTDPSKFVIYTYVVAAKPADVFAFYNKIAAAAGLVTISGEQSSAPYHFSASRMGTHKAFIAAEITNQSDGKTWVQVRYK